jgi:Ni,Fe-hydrogenase III small subunit/formate hydrogenlyase subunit 6/NADH:ubiquinone oxidoreductase subunit I
MLRSFIARLRQGHRTMRYPAAPVVLPDRFRGLPKLTPSACTDKNCTACAAACPTGAIALEPKLAIDMGKCLFCTACTAACPHKAITFTQEHSLAAGARNDLILGEKEFTKAESLKKEMLRIFGRSLKLRQVSAGGCNACEADINVLGTIAWDLGRFGIQIVASPRHADGLIITGPVTKNMHTALLKTYEAVPDPKIIIACGACAISGGPFTKCDQHNSGIGDLLPVDLFVPGCPPHPFTILDGLLRLLGKIK